MEQSTISPQSWLLTFWFRIGLACLMFLDAVLMMPRHFLRFDWVPWLCMGLSLLLYAPMQRGTTEAAYLKKPRSIAVLALVAAGIVGFGLNFVRSVN